MAKLKGTTRAILKTKGAAGTINHAPKSNPGGRKLLARQYKDVRKKGGHKGLMKSWGIR